MKNAKFSPMTGEKLKEDEVPELIEKDKKKYMQSVVTTWVIVIIVGVSFGISLYNYIEDKSTTTEDKNINSELSNIINEEKNLGKEKMIEYFHNYKNVATAEEKLVYKFKYEVADDGIEKLKFYNSTADESLSEKNYLGYMLHKNGDKYLSINIGDISEKINTDKLQEE